MTWRVGSSTTNTMPGVSIAASRAGRLVLARSYGWAHVTERRPLTPDHCIATGSCTKLLTTMAVLTAVEAGLTSLETPVYTIRAGDTIARHGLTSAQFQQESNRATGKGFRPVCVSGYGEGAGTRFAAIWEKRPGPAWRARHGMSGAYYQVEVARVHAQLLAEAGTHGLVGVQRAGLTSAAVEREDQLPAQSLVQGLPTDECLELADQRGVPAAGEVGLDAVLHDLQALRVQPAGVTAERGEPVEAHEGGSTPQPERLPQQVRGLRVPGSRQRLPTLASQHPELVDVHLRRGAAEHVAPALGDQQPPPVRPLTVPSAARFQCRPQLGDVAAQHRRCRARRPAVPAVLDQPVVRDDLVRVHREQREDRLRTWTTQGYRASVPHRLRRTQQTYPHVHREAVPSAVCHCVPQQAHGLPVSAGTRGDHPDTGPGCTRSLPDPRAHRGR